MYSVNTCKDGLIYRDGNLTIRKISYCSHASFELVVSNESMTAISKQNLDPTLFEHNLNEDGLIRITQWSEYELEFPIFITFTSANSYQACCKVLEITPKLSLIKNSKTVISHEL